MKTVLIVEDEKLIRQGLKTMVRRSGVPVETILECSNGEMALEILKEQKVDLMFTDIRMPKMDGIELVKRVQDIPDKPLIVAISGYDDFSYAVEMLRNGVREYILKPIEREKITAILTTLNEEIEKGKADADNLRKLGFSQMKHLLELSEATPEEISAIEKQYEGEFYTDNYYVVCAAAGDRAEKFEENLIVIKNVSQCDLFVVTENRLSEVLNGDLLEEYVGISEKHTGIGQLRTAYKEALIAREKAFCTNEKRYEINKSERLIPEGLIKEAEKQLGADERLKRVQLIGTDRSDELTKSLHALIFETENGRISPKKFSEYMQVFLSDVKKTYRTVVAEDEETINSLTHPFDYASIKVYEEELCDYLLWLNGAANSRLDDSRSNAKLKEAVEYIDAHYNEDLNMAVVSNMVSMNYSLFSYSFKQYTGSNFVNYLKDIRIREAKRLLKETDMKVAEIAQTVGYDNEKHFMKTFKANCGVSPTEFRKNTTLS